VAEVVAAGEDADGGLVGDGVGGVLIGPFGRRWHPDDDTLAAPTTPLPARATPAPTGSPPTPPTVIPASSVHPPPDLPIPCLLRPCSGPLFFPSASALAQHYRSAHRPLTSIPSSALVPYLFRCKLCRDAVYSNPASLAKPLSL